MAAAWVVHTPVDAVIRKYCVLVKAVQGVKFSYATVDVVKDVEEAIVQENVVVDAASPPSKLSVVPM